MDIKYLKFVIRKTVDSSRRQDQLR